MRKHIRSIMKTFGEKKKVKASKYVNVMWERYQIKKHGTKNVVINRAKGTHKKKNWHDRIIAATEG